MRIRIMIGGKAYYIAGTTETKRLADSAAIYEGRLLNDVYIIKTLSSAGSVPTTLSLLIRNNDDHIPTNVSLWGVQVDVDPNNGQHSWAGKVTAYFSDDSGTLHLTVTEKSAPELSLKIPDEVARLFYVDENFHVSAINATMPLVIGGNASKPIMVKGVLKDKVNGIYLLCVGEIWQVVNVYRGTEKITTGFEVYTGTSTQADYKGFAYIRITDPDLLENEDGTYAEFSAEVIGLRFGNHSIEECRNGARFIKYLLETPSAGICAWGLGVSSSKIDLASFDDAIAAVDAANLKLDGVLYFRQQALSWIDQVCQVIRGNYEIGRSGLRRLFVNSITSSVYTYDKNNSKLLRHGKDGYDSRVFNKGKLDFDFNPVTGQFMQSVNFSDSASISEIEEQEFYGQSYLLRDITTAQAILDYTCQRSIIGAETVYLETPKLVSGCQTGDKITLDYPEKGLTGTYNIIVLEVGERIHRIKAEKFSSSIFTTESSGSEIDWGKDLPIVSVVRPAAPTGLVLDTGARPNGDGTSHTFISGSFILPGKGYIGAALFYGEGDNPTTWINKGLIQGSQLEITPLKAGTKYSVKIQMVSATAKSAFVYSSITTPGDTTAPGVPSCVAFSAMKRVDVKISLLNPPSDLAGFQVWRAASNNSGAAQVVGMAPAKVMGGESSVTVSFPDTANNYGDTYYYFVKSFDRWSNLSDFSQGYGPVTITAINGADMVNEALNRSELFKKGVVDGPAIALGAVTAEKILVGNPGAALNDDPNFKDQSAWRQRGTNNLIPESAFTNISDGKVGNSAIQAIGYVGAISAKTIFVDSSKRYRLRMWVRQSTTTETTNYLTTRFINPDGSLQAQNWPKKLLKSTTHWEEMYVLITPPSNAVAVIIGADLNYYAVNSTVYAQDLRLEETIPGILLEDGCVTTPKLVAGAVEAGKIAAGAVETGHLSAGAVTAEKVDATVAKMQELQVVGKNLCPDAAFRDVKFGQTTVNIAGQTIGDWHTASYGAGFVGQLHKQSGIYLKEGSNGLMLKCSNTESASVTSSYLKIKPSVNYYVSAYGITPDGSTYGLNYYSRLVWFDENQNFISETNITKSYNFPTLTRFGISATAPSNAAFCKIHFSLDYSNNKRLIISAVQLEEGTAPTVWVNGEQGQVTADRVVTGLIKSLNYSTTQGSSFDLDNGNFKAGGSSNPIFEFDVATLTGKLSGFTFNSTDLTAGSSINAIGISTDAAKPAFWAGDENGNNAPFRVNKDGTGKVGDLFLTNAGLTNSDCYTDGNITHGITIATKPIDSPVNMFDMPAPGIDLVGYTTGPYQYNRVRLSASGYYDGAGYEKAMIQVACPGTGYYGFTTNGYVNALSGFRQLSDKERKTNFQEIKVLEKLSEIEIKKYQLDKEILDLDFAISREAEISPTCIVNANNTKAEFVKIRSEIIYEYEKLELYEKEQSKRLIELKAKESELLNKIEQIKQKRAQSIINRKVLSDKRKQFLEEKRAGKRKGQAEKNAPFYINAMAEQFNKAFGTANGTKKGLTLSDEIGVALRAIQELNELRKAEKENHKNEVKALNERLAALEAAIQNLTQNKEH